MKIDVKSKTVRVTFAKGEFRILAALLAHAQREKQRNPVSWLAEPKAVQKMLVELLGVCHGLNGYDTVHVDDATKLDPAYRDGVLDYHYSQQSTYRENRRREHPHLEHDLALTPGGLDGDDLPPPPLCPTCKKEPADVVHGTVLECASCDAVSRAAVVAAVVAAEEVIEGRIRKAKGGAK